MKKVLLPRGLVHFLSRLRKLKLCVCVLSCIQKIKKKICPKCHTFLIDNVFPSSLESFAIFQHSIKVTFRNKMSTLDGLNTRPKVVMKANKNGYIQIVYCTFDKTGLILKMVCKVGRPKYVYRSLLNELKIDVK